MTYLVSQTKFRLDHYNADNMGSLIKLDCESMQDAIDEAAEDAGAYSDEAKKITADEADQSEHYVITTYSGEWEDGHIHGTKYIAFN